MVRKKIIVIGCPGSGKSTFAVKLERRTGLPLIHLDSIWWKPDRTHISREEFDARLDAVVRAEKWIIEGDYSRTYEKRISACDTVIFLDVDEAECLRGIEERLGQERPELPWTEDAPDPELVEDVRQYREKKRPVLLSLLKKYPDKKVLIFHSRNEADRWLEKECFQ